MLCISRVTDEKIAQKFGDGKHNFHIEMRCNLPCMANSDICEKCVTKSATYKTHGSRKFDQGKVNEPIPDHSHIFGGKWYQMRVGDWGTPPSEIIRFAQQYQAEARQGYIVVDPDYSTMGQVKQHQAKQHKVDEQKKEIVSTMPRGRKPKVTVSQKDETEKTSINIRDITIAGDENAPIATTATATTATATAPTENNVVKKRRPTVAAASTVSTVTIAEDVSNDKKEEKKARGVTRKKATTEEANQKEAAPKKRSPKKQVSSPAPEPITNPLLVDQPILFQEAVIPTILEQDIEQVDTDGYEIEYITLREFELNNTTYYIEGNKGKLYKKVKGGIGPYVGRYHKDLEEIDTSVPDSDDES